MNRAILSLLVVFGIVACRKPPEPPAASALKPTAAWKAIGYARQIVCEPSNWRANTVLLTDLGAAAQDLKIAETHEFKEFDAAAQDLIRFGTSWVSSLDE